ncbi:MAG: DNA-binding protein [Proteobacteria bacterium]|nr:DNA-binding protein [Pseudomonadota bacterium]
MKYSTAKQGRVFVLRLEDGEVVHEEIERFAAEHAIAAATLIVVGGAGKGSKLVVGPENRDARPIDPMLHLLDDVHEIAGTGTLFPDEKGNPTLHMHLAAGRKDETITGCVRSGVVVWQIMEVILFELVDTSGKRSYDEALGFNLLVP